MEVQPPPAPIQEGETFEPEPANSNANRLSSQAVPPYWHHTRSTSWATASSVDHDSPITLHDNDGTNSQSQSRLWAKAVTIDDYVIINGSNATGIGAYVVWICQVETLDGSPMIIRKRYSEFDQLRNDLLKAFPHTARTSLPPLPSKSAIYKFRAKFLEKRRTGLAYFLNCILLDPVYSGSPVVKNFIFKNEVSGR